MPKSNSTHDSPPPDGVPRRDFLLQAGAIGCGIFGTTPALIAAQPLATDADPKSTPNPDPNSGLAGIKALLSRKEPVMWVITGDSITHGALHTLGWRSYPEHFAERVRWELRRVRDLVVNTGISGDRTGGLLADIDWRALHLQPDVVSVMLGMNDCTAGPDGREVFRKNLTAIVDRVQAAGAIPLLNTPNTVYIKNSAGRADLPTYAAIVREVATATRAGLVDHWTHWEKTKPDQETLLAWIEDSSIHPGVYGHREFAKLIFRELGIFDPESPTCKLEVK
ncbi:MAG: SGNH/GDSL hydrolase family protein [Planctomycetaceae bacterium]|nr:SGNH/GDSL hydrolase family protein [Planctomycetaceae bacterium]